MINGIQTSIIASDFIHYYKDIEEFCNWLRLECGYVLSFAVMNHFVLGINWNSIRQADHDNKLS